MSLQKEDVYETEDVPVEPQDVRIEDNIDSEEVEKVHIDVDAALTRFKGRLLNADDVDFSDSIVRKHRRGYTGGAYVLEVLGPLADEEETAEQKYARLNCELNELLETVRNQNKAEGAEMLVNEEDLLNMIETLKEIQLEAVAPSAKPKLVVHSSSAAKHIISSQDSRLVALEDRASRLEKILENGADDSSNLSQIPLASAVEDLRMRVQALHPAHVDSLHSRITQLLSKLEQVNDKKAERTDIEMEYKINSLFDLMTKWDAACTGLPSAVQRMHGLRKLHEQAEQFGMKLNHLCGLRDQLLKAMHNEGLTMLEFRQQTMEAIMKLSADIEKLEKRLSEIAS